MSKKKQLKLKKIFQRRELKATENKFTVDFRKDDKEFKAKEILEYEYQGKYYVIVEANHDFCYQLSNGKYYKDGDYVLPVNWLVDEKSDLMISEKLLFAGILLHRDRNNVEHFSKTDLKKYLDQYFVKELTIREQIKVNICENLDQKSDKIEAFLEEIENRKAHFLKEKNTLLEGIQTFSDQKGLKVKHLSF